jgi:t-SNARE complex subunit (syntaxin)
MSFEVGNQYNMKNPDMPIPNWDDLAEQEVNHDQALIEETNMGVKLLEKDLADLMASMRIYRNLVADQGEGLNQVEDVLQEVEANIEQGTATLEHVEAHIQGERKEGLFATIGGISGGGIGALGFIFSPLVGVVTMVISSGLGAGIGFIIGKVKA